MNPWRRFVLSSERRLAAESDPVKIAGRAVAGFDRLLPGADPDDLAGLLRFVESACGDPAAFFRPAGTPDFSLDGRELVYSSLGHDPPDHPNRKACALIHHSRGRERGVVLLPYWNAARADAAGFAALLARGGIGCLQLSLPYHDARQTPASGFAREMASENLGLTIQANRQAVLDARAALDWLEANGYRRLGVVGLSLGSSIAAITAAFDERVKAVALLLAAGDFAEVMWTGSATRHVRAALERDFTLEQVKAAWRIISPHSHIPPLAGRIREPLIVSAALDTVFPSELTRDYIGRLEQCGLRPRSKLYGCGHYTLGLLPYALRAAYDVIAHLRRAL